jgi:hypothetical protein
MLWVKGVGEKWGASNRKQVFYRVTPLLKATEVSKKDTF